MFCIWCFKLPNFSKLLAGDLDPLLFGEALSPMFSWFLYVWQYSERENMGDISSLEQEWIWIYLHINCNLVVCLLLQLKNRYSTIINFASIYARLFSSVLSSHHLHTDGNLLSFMFCLMYGCICMRVLDFFFLKLLLISLLHVKVTYFWRAE